MSQPEVPFWVYCSLLWVHVGRHARYAARARAAAALYDTLSAALGVCAPWPGILWHRSHKSVCGMLAPLLLLSSSRPLLQGSFEGGWDYPLLMPDDLVSLHGVNWRTEPGRVDGPLLLPQMPWDLGTVGAGGAGTVLWDPREQLYKCWYVASPALSDAPYSPASGPDDGRVLAFATSRDGVRWQRPQLDIFPYGNYSKTNIVLALSESTQGKGKVQYASVNLNVDAAVASQRYEMFVVMTGDSVTHWFSPDGMRWVRAPSKPLWPPRGGSDSIYVYKQLLPGENYTAFIKTSIPASPGWLSPFDIGSGSSRVISKSVSADGTHWDRAEIALSACNRKPWLEQGQVRGGLNSGWQLCAAPDWRDGPGDEFVELTATRARALGGGVGSSSGGGALLLGTLTTIHAVRDQTIDLQFGASRDGVSWCAAFAPDRALLLVPQFSLTSVSAAVAVAGGARVTGARAFHWHPPEIGAQVSSGPFAPWSPTRTKMELYTCTTPGAWDRTVISTPRWPKKR
eukprot:COSAG01_NODE_1848_length_9066_cov_6.023754_10_plen_512_part_00